METEWKTEFPDFPGADMPPIPDTWADSSWGNDLCPSFTVFESGAGDSAQWSRLVVWCDWKDSALREWPESTRFIVQYINDGDGQTLVTLVSDSWADVMAYVLPREILARRYIARVGYNPFLDCPEINPDQIAETLAESLSMGGTNANG